MAHAAWSRIVTKKRVPEAESVAWTPVLDYVGANKVIKVVVANTNDGTAQTWHPPEFAAPCTADGDYEEKETRGTAGKRAGLLTNAPIGALIGRMGGSTADKTIDTSSPPPAIPSRLAFPVGRHCVLVVPQAPLGALYLGVNDNGPGMVGLKGFLLVDVYEAT